MQPDLSSSTRDPADRDEQSLVTRRQLLGAVGAVGGGAGVAWGLAGAGELPRDPATIVYARARRRPGDRRLRPRTKEVPVEWHRQLQLAFDVQRELAATGLSSLVGLFVEPGSYDDRAASVSVTATDGGIRKAIDDLARDVSIDLNILDDLPPARDAEPPLDQAAQIPDLDWNRVRSGYLCTAAELFGTVAPALYDRRDGSRYFATSNHLFGDGGRKESEHACEPLSLFLDGDRRPIGQVDRGYPRADVVRVEPVDGYRPVSEIARATPGTVIGQYTRAGLADLMARGERLQKVGALSGRTAGRIKGVAGITCFAGEICKPGQLKWGDQETIVDGDSGSVSYHVDPEHPEEYVLVAGFNNARTWWPGMEFSWGTAGYHLHESYGLHF